MDLKTKTDQAIADMEAKAEAVVMDGRPQVMTAWMRSVVAAVKAIREEFVSRPAGG